MTAEPKTSSVNALREIAMALRALVAAVLRAIGKLIATIWRVVGALDAALWNGFKLFFMAIARAVATVAGALGRGATDFVRWLPTRAGRAYAAISGVILVIASLWIIDELRAVSREQASIGGAAARPPIDEEDPILARIGSRYIHLSDIEAAARSSGQLSEEAYLTPLSAFERGLVDNYVDQTLLAAAAQDEGVARTPTIARKLRAAREQILAAAFLQSRIDATVTADSVRGLYDSQADVTRLGDEVRARHIVTATEEEAAAIIEALDAGADFADLARESSIDRATSPLGGALGYFTKDMMTPGLSRAAFETPAGERAPVFETEFGWHVLEVIDRRETRSVAFADVEEDIRKFLTLRTIDETLGALRSNSRVTLYRPDVETRDEPPQLDEAVP